MRDQTEYDVRLMDVLEGALACSPSEREAYLRDACEADTKLYSDVQSRLGWEDKMVGFLAESILPPAFAGVSPGELVASRFRIIRELGRGGMGIVYEALDQKLDRRIAAKFAFNGLTDRLSPEACAALEISHPNVCKVHEVHTAQCPSGPVDFITMELLNGETAADRLERDGPFAPEEVRRLALQLCAGLAEAHRQGVIHGDLKPQNVMLTESPDAGGRAVLTDFGLARITRPDDREIRASGGTLSFMAPELLRGAPPSVQTDVYALGVLLHLLRTGELPGRSRPTAAPRLGPLRSRPERLLKGVISRCLSTDPAKRFESADQIATILASRLPVAIPTLIAVSSATLVLCIALSLRASPVPAEPVRLGISVESKGALTAAAIGADVADRLNGLRSRFTVLPPVNVATAAPPTLSSFSGATHVLSVSIRPSGGKMIVDAHLLDAASGETLRNLKGEYHAADTAPLARALVATVTRHFGLRSRDTKETVVPAAYAEYLRGLELLRQDPRTAPDAIPFFQKAAALDGRSALPLAGLAQARMQAFRLEGAATLDDARRDIERARSIDPDSVAVLLASGTWLQLHGRYEQALDDLKRAAELEPLNAEAWRALASACAKSDRGAEAISAYRKAIEMQPDDYLNYAGLGALYLERNEFRNAEAVFRSGVSVGKSVAAAYMNLGVALLLQGRYDESRKLLLESLRLRRTPPVLMNLGTLHYEQERYSEARRWYEEAVAAASPSARRFRVLGDAYRHLSLPDKARDAYRKGVLLAENEISRNPRDAVTRGLLASMYAQLREGRRADTELAQAIALEPGNSFVQRDAVIAWEAMGQREKVLRMLDHAPIHLLSQLNRSPDLRNLQADKQFRAALTRLGPMGQ